MEYSTQAEQLVALNPPNWGLGVAYLCLAESEFELSIAAFNTVHNIGNIDDLSVQPAGLESAQDHSVPDGSLAANVGVSYVEQVYAGLYEPVCTHPDHRRKGLAQALMREGMHRLKALGATEVTVGTGAMVPANRMYDSVGFPEVHRGYHWRKVW